MGNKFVLRNKTDYFPFAKENYLHITMGVKHSKQSVDISSTPKKGALPVEEVNGKTIDEKVEEITKLNGEVEKPKAANGDAPASNGDVKGEEKEGGDAVVEEDKNDETKENEEAEDVAEVSKDEGKKKISTKDKIKKKLSIRSINFL